VPAFFCAVAVQALFRAVAAPALLGAVCVIAFLHAVAWTFIGRFSFCTGSSLFRRSSPDRAATVASEYVVVRC
jgi:hypothetical protein